MLSIITWIVIFCVVAALGVAGPILLRAYQNGENPTAAFFKPRPDPRLEVVELQNVDSKRRLVLIRRDDVEHLIMTGGPVDVVIETGIGEAQGRSAETTQSAQSATVFTRAPRSLGQASGTEGA